ncbi:MAG: glycosyltransferase family 2 protein [Desulfosoma sp.]
MPLWYPLSPGRLPSPRSAAPIRRVVAIVVNYFSATLTLRAVASILASPCPASVTVVVVDNSESPQEAAVLERDLPKPVRLIVAPHNLGFGQACTMAWKKCPGDALLLLNPDAYLLGRCLENMLDVLNADGRIGAVGPKIYWDPLCRFLLPPSVPPNWILMLSVADRLGFRAAPFLRAAGELWRRQAVRAWATMTPFPVKNLSGGSVLLRAEAVRDVGGLFDPRFFLYFEDTDLFVRMRERGWRLVVCPKAAVVHEFDRCGLEGVHIKRRLMADSHKIFLRKHFPWYELFVRHVPQVRHRDMAEADPGETMPRYCKPFRIFVPPEITRPWLFEWSPNANFIPAAAAFGTGRVAEFPEDCFERLSPGRYFGRIGSVNASIGSRRIRFSFVVESTQP